MVKIARALAMGGMLVLAAGCNELLIGSTCNGSEVDCEAAMRVARSSLPAGTQEMQMVSSQIEFFHPGDDAPCREWRFCINTFESVARVEMTYPGPAAHESWTIPVVRFDPDGAFELVPTE